MSGGALILTYHAIALFERHLDCIVAAGSRTVTVATLAEAVRRGERLDGLVAITFDDGFASVARTAWPLLAERGLTATVFCVAGYLGGANDWPTQATGAPRLPLADAASLTALAAEGVELGAHGSTHAPLNGGDSDVLDRELAGARVESVERIVAIVSVLGCARQTAVHARWSGRVHSTQYHIQYLGPGV